MSRSGDQESKEMIDTTSGANSAASASAIPQDISGNDPVAPVSVPEYEVDAKLLNFNQQVQRNFQALDSITLSSSLSIAPRGFLGRMFSVSTKERFAYLTALATSL